MSGVCALLRLDGGPAEGIEPVLARLARRGPDARRHWSDGPIALGHALLATTPEALHEVLPLVHAPTGCAISADARLDNRDELLPALGLEGRPIGDGALILHAWLAWGEAALPRLLGDWAFALWDPRSRTLVAARDPLGMRQLHYAHLPGRLLALATDAEPVLAAPGIPRDLDEGRIADVLEEWLEPIDDHSTFHRSVQRLPPAHLLVIGPQGLTLRRYWALEAGPALTLSGDREHEEAFRGIFEDAVRARLRAPGRVGVMLSGGIDSGSVAAVASRLLAADGRGPLPTFSVTGGAGATDPETQGIAAMVAAIGAKSHAVAIDALEPWVPDLLDAAREALDPFEAYMNVQRLCCLAARRAGVRVMLDGVAGDVTLGSPNALAHLLRSGRWRRLRREARAEQRFLRDTVPAWRLVAEAARDLAVPDHLWARLRHPFTPPGRPARPLLAPRFAREVDFAARVRRSRQRHHIPICSERDDRAIGIGGPVLLAGTERYDRVAGVLGVERRDPFMDLRVIRFALGCAADQMRRDGWPKHLLRRAMASDLPDSVTWKPGRDHLSMALLDRLLPHGPALLPSSGGVPVAAEALLRRAIGRGYGQLDAGTLPKDLRWETWFLAQWMARALR